MPENLENLQIAHSIISGRKESEEEERHRRVLFFVFEKNPTLFLKQSESFLRQKRSELGFPKDSVDFDIWFYDATRQIEVSKHAELQKKALAEQSESIQKCLELLAHPKHLADLFSIEIVFDAVANETQEQVKKTTEK